MSIPAYNDNQGTVSKPLGNNWYCSNNRFSGTCYARCRKS